MSARQFASLLSLVCLATACNTLPETPGKHVDSAPNSGSALEQHAPIEVAIAPITDSSGNTALPRSELRKAFQGALLRRRYTPIALDLVDSKVVNAAYRPGSLEEQAVLMLDVERWDTRLWDSRNVIEVTIRARVIAPDNPSGELWSGVLEKRCDFSAVQEQYATEGALRRFACEQIANELLEAMPARQPVPGRAKP